ncbi:hypothetical protein [Stieleria mannarensis]|uniref:hypothetical protein n=1 Tax=Stieleria mannarensis TaxID=2755585 RepID=UPI001602C36C|nr:hypothetical protein [Rhodopirellula sp. JC639]
MIVNKSKLDRDHVSDRRQSEGAAKAPRDRVDDPVADLQDLVLFLRRDAADDPMHYLIRSNTLCDGE